MFQKAQLYYNNPQLECKKHDGKRLKILLSKTPFEMTVENNVKLEKRTS